MHVNELDCISFLSRKVQQILDVALEIRKARMQPLIALKECTLHVDQEDCSAASHGKRERKRDRETVRQRCNGRGWSGPLARESFKHTHVLTRLTAKEKVKQ